MQLAVSVVEGASLPIGRGKVDATVVALPVAPDPGQPEDDSPGTLVPTGWALPDALVNGPPRS
jgi:hypothetical protein